MLTDKNNNTTTTLKNMFGKLKARISDLHFYRFVPRGNLKKIIYGNNQNV